MASCKLSLKNMIFYGHHGVYPAEKELGQRIEVDIELISGLLNAGKTDSLEQTIDYVTIYAMVKNIIEKGSYHLIEGMAFAIVDRIMTSCDFEKVTVRVRKPQPPVGGLMDTVEFEISREQE